MREILDANFDEMVGRSDVPVLVDFWAPWCGPCLALTPVLNQIEEEYSGIANVFKMNIDENPFTPQEYAIRTIPTMLLFVGGNAVECLVGAQSKAKIKSVIDKYLY